ncbi:hypothetical protein GCM10010424_62760 [Streptomyces lienomycini]
MPGRTAVRPGTGFRWPRPVAGLLIGFCDHYGPLGAPSLLTRSVPGSSPRAGTCCSTGFAVSPTGPPRACTTGRRSAQKDASEPDRRCAGPRHQRPAGNAARRPKPTVTSAISVGAIIPAGRTGAPTPSTTTAPTTPLAKIAMLNDVVSIAFAASAVSPAASPQGGLRGIASGELAEDTDVDGVTSMSHRSGPGTAPALT